MIKLKLSLLIVRHPEHPAIIQTEGMREDKSLQLVACGEEKLVFMSSITTTLLQETRHG